MHVIIIYGSLMKVPLNVNYADKLGERWKNTKMDVNVRR